MVEISVRPATPADQEVLARIYRRASLMNDGDRAALLAHPAALRLRDDLITDGRTLVAVMDSTVVGFASTSSIRPGVLELDDLFSDPGWLRRGVARRLIQHVVAQTAQEGVTRLEVTANDHALDFYRAVGFVTDGRVETELGVGTRMHVDI